MKIILGSQSKGRKKVLSEMGYDFEVMVADIDEKAIRLDDPVELTMVLARAKADVLLPEIKEPAILITSDQVVVCNEKILEKPASEKEAREYYEMYACYPAETITSVVVVSTLNGKRAEGTDIAKVWMCPLPEEIISKYIETGDPFKNAGAFDHEYPLVAEYIERIEGEPESVTGLPKKLTQKLILEVQNN